MVAAILAVRTRCEIRWDASICGGRATTVHEPLSRGRGGSIVDPDNAMAACIPCNEAASANPDEAVRRGVLRHSWDRDREAA